MNTLLRHRFPSIRFTFLLALTSLLISACGGGGSDGGSSSSGSSSAPSSIVGLKLVETITDVTIISNPISTSFLGTGDTLTYQFIDRSTVLGEGFVAIPTSSWRYSVSGNTANVTLNLESGSIGGTIEDELVFDTSNSGTFTSLHSTTSGTKVRYEGNFRVSATDNSGGSNDGGDTSGGGTGSGGSQQACETNNTGTITFYLSNADAIGSVDLSLSGEGSRSTSSYFSSGSPECGSTSSGMTFSDISAGSYTYSAADQDRLTWDGTVRISQCECILFELR